MTGRMRAARTAWESVYTWCRSFLVRAQAYAPDCDIAMRRLLLRWTIALPYLMRSHLSDYKPGSDALQHLLTVDEVRSRGCY